MTEAILLSSEFKERHELLRKEFDVREKLIREESAKRYKLNERYSERMEALIRNEIQVRAARGLPELDYVTRMNAVQKAVEAQDEAIAADRSDELHAEYDRRLAQLDAEYTARLSRL
jgi:hypothetical protein